MKRMASFNQKETLLAITSYPNPQDGSLGKKEFNAVGWHSEKTLTQLSKHAPVVVFAEQREGPALREVNDNLVISRAWKKGNPLSFISLLSTMLGFTKVKNIFVQFEFNVFGGIIPNLVLLAILSLLRITGRHVTFELHQVITDIALLQKHINIRNPLLQRFFNLSLKIFYVILGLVASEIIVFEEELKNRLSVYIKADKIHVLSLAVEAKEVVSQKKAKNLTNLPHDEFTLLVFGFINGYKGIDWIINALKAYQGKKVRLVIAGGENPYLKDQPHYQKFYQSVINEAKKYEHVTVTGFVPDEKVSLYFSAADLVIMPYEVFMAASGPFSLALSYGKPIILSGVLEDYAVSEDFKAALTLNGLTKKDIFFSLRPASLIHLIEKARVDASSLEQLTNFSRTLARLRASDVVTKRLFDIITSKPLSPIFPLDEQSLRLS